MYVPHGMTYHTGRREYPSGSEIDESTLSEPFKTLFAPWNTLVTKAVATGVEKAQALAMSTSELETAIASASSAQTSEA
jgi:hypothetical protein